MDPKIRTVVIKDGGKKAVVSGPIRWDLDETSATFSAVIAQMSKGGATVLATGQNGKVFRNPADQTWKAVVRTAPGDLLVAGNADGWAVAAVLETTGLHECYPWQVDNLDVT